MAEMGEPENLKLCVRNTFLHVLDADQEAQKLSRSASDSSLLTSGSKSDRSEEQYSTPAAFFSFEDDSANSQSAPSQGPEAVQTTPLPQVNRISWSLGAEFHEDNECRPCAWNWRPSGCVNATECVFCHMCPEGALRSKKKQRSIKAKVDRTPARVLDPGLVQPRSDAFPQASTSSSSTQQTVASATNSGLPVGPPKLVTRSQALEARAQAHQAAPAFRSSRFAL